MNATVVTQTEHRHNKTTILCNALPF